MQELTESFLASIPRESADRRDPHGFVPRMLGLLKQRNTKEISADKYQLAMDVLIVEMAKEGEYACVIFHPPDQAVVAFGKMSAAERKMAHAKDKKKYFQLLKAWEQLEDAPVYVPLGNIESLRALGGAGRRLKARGGYEAERDVLRETVKKIRREASLNGQIMPTEDELFPLRQREREPGEDDLAA